MQNQNFTKKTQRSLQKFLEPDRKPKVIYTDNSLEFGKACEDLSWNHCTSTPHRSETNGIAERAVRGVKDGTSAVLLQSGLNENWWADSMECQTYLRNIQDLSQESINLERKSYLDCSSDTLLYAGGIWKGDVLVASLRTRNSKKPSRMLVRSWNHQLLLLCLVKF